MHPHIENDVYIKYDYDTIQLTAQSTKELYEKFKFKIFVVILHSEQNLDSLETVIQIFSFLKEKNVQCFWVYSGMTKHFQASGFDNVKTICWPTSHLHTMLHFDNVYPDVDEYKLDLNIPKKIYLNLNNTDKYHRIIMMDYLCKYGLLDDGIISWNTINTFKRNGVFPAKKWVPTLSTVDSNFQHLKNERMYHKYNTEFYKNNKNSFFIELVTESEENSDLIRFTEKTWKPILYGKPFIAMSGKHFHKNLTRLGFYLYDEIINYDFDNISLLNFKKKPKMICENLLNLKTLDLLLTQKIIEDKVVKNTKNAIEIYKKNKYVDNEFIKFIFNTTPNFYKHFFNDKHIKL
jgi:hypothetical protein